MSAAPITAARQRLNAARASEACQRAGITDPEELPSMAAFARTAEIYHAALTNYRRLKGAHGRFAATHDDDDPAHQQHQEGLSRAHKALQAAEREFIKTLIGWREARGETPDATFAGESRGAEKEATA